MIKNGFFGVRTMLFFSFASFQIIFFGKPVLSVDTKWEKISESLSQLLDDGWQVSAHSSNRAATSPGASGYRPYDEETYTFLLIKNKKYILCVVENPKPPSTQSGCRKLN